MSRPIAAITAIGLLFFSALTSAVYADASVSGNTADAQKYLDVVIDVNTKLKDAGFKLGLALGPLYQETEPSAQQLDTALANAKQTYTDVIEATKRAKPPKGPEAEALQQAHAAFMSGQRKIVNEQFQQLVDSAKNTKLSLEERKLALDAGLQKITDIEKESLDPLVNAFTAYVEKYDLKTPDPNESE